MANGKCRMEVARPKRTVVTLFDMQKFHKLRSPYRKINTPTMNVCLRVLDSKAQQGFKLFSIEMRSSFPRVNGLLSPTLHR